MITTNIYLGLNLSNIIIGCINHLHPTNPSLIQMLNNIISSSSFMTLGTTLLTTSLIAYRIRSVMLLDKLHHKHSPFQNILDLIVQSAAPYAVACLAYATVGAIPITMENEWKLFIAQAYAGVAFPIIAVCFSYLYRRGNVLNTTVL